jgi:hypothetical protein
MAVLDCYVVRETEKAWLVEIEGMKYWVPKSRCHLHTHRERIEIPDRLWQKKQEEEWE